MVRFFVSTQVDIRPEFGYPRFAFVLWSSPLLTLVVPGITVDIRVIRLLLGTDRLDPGFGNDLGCQLLDLSESHLHEVDDLGLVSNVQRHMRVPMIFPVVIFIIVIIRRVIYYDDCLALANHGFRLDWPFCLRLFYLQESYNIISNEDSKFWTWATYLLLEDRLLF